jgi:hypothetical protein
MNFSCGECIVVYKTLPGFLLGPTWHAESDARLINLIAVHLTWVSQERCDPRVCAACTAGARSLRQAVTAHVLIVLDPMSLVWLLCGWASGPTLANGNLWHVLASKAGSLGGAV